MKITKVPKFPAARKQPIEGNDFQSMTEVSIDRFRYFFIYDLEKFTELPFPDCLQACEAFYKVENNIELKQSDFKAVANYLTWACEKLARVICEEMGINLYDLTKSEAQGNVKRIREQTSITSQHLDIETVEVYKGKWDIILLINLIC